MHLYHDLQRRLTWALTGSFFLLTPLGPGCQQSPAAPSAREVAGFEVANVAPARVQEALQGDGSTYLHIQEAQWDFWVKTPTSTAQPGDHVLIGRGPQRVRYASAALGRTFDTLIETPEVKVVSAEESARLIRLAPPEGGVSVGDLYARREALRDTPVKVRGRVVKASKNIFETNWYHLQDGSGAEGTDDLTVTSTAQAEVGDVVLVEGPLTLDHDLGFGYRYDAILLDAALRVEEASGRPSDPAAAAGPPAWVRSAAPSASTQQPPSSPPDREWDALIAAQQEREREAATERAPTRDVLGLTLGASDDPAITAWFTQRGVPCTGEASPRRQAVRYACAPPSGALQERPSRGRLSELLMTRPDDGPLEHVLIAHQFSAPDAALEEYAAREQALSRALGQPAARQVPPEAGALSGTIARYVTSWRFQDLKVEVALVKIQGSVRLNERWSLQSSTARFKMRPGAQSAHGAVKASPNPHLLAP